MLEFNEFTIIAGPCVIESEDLALKTAQMLKKMLPNIVYKSSFDKANRSSISSYRGPGIDEGLRILEKVRTEFDIPIFTDVHSPEQAKIAGEVCDYIQIPAFLCRQTDLLVAAAKTGKKISVKKGQFMAPWDMKYAIDKLVESGNDQIILTERGFSFGYNNLVSDMRAIPIMQKLGHPVCFDATHSVQLPGGLGASSGGEREFVETLAMAALAAGADLLYIETHPDPDNALCDAKTQLPLKDLERLLKKFIPLYELMHA
ncbi:MAG: 2-dehydro-3-deoxyphosphooctonate aldolase [Chlamydiia bacterium]|nr:2-dehydro-3-deoxyphosphooctonate aldolase [Chlamydiia bacterium]MCH9616690.1 2-dehydro-3-deoxyphosphooctonate aldolase [Chlamydiia bacterium]MCH9629421.1 2-dehydro-3-deoxyphosphooctonate aldolase [Chlamydiia bacterium]